MIKHLDGDFDKEIKGKRILVDFYADWCGPCQMQGEVLKSFNDIDVLKVDVDKYQQVAKTYGIMSIPTLLLFEDGKMLRSNVGFMNITDLKNFTK